MRLALDVLNPRDTFNLITFSGDTSILFPEPVPATPANLRLAQEFLAGRHGSGGTEMMKAIRASLDPSDASDHVRIVCFMTDGYVGNDMEIIGEVQKHPNARVFAFGIGSSVNRFLLDGMARAGRGEVEYVGLNDDGSAAARRFHERVRNPLLTDITIDWGGLPVQDVYPARIPDLFAAKPLVIHGRYSGAASGNIVLRGKIGGRDFTRTVKVNLPGAEPKHDVLASLWARTRIEELMSRDWAGLQRGTMQGDVQKQITELGLTYRLMTQFTSFVAVEEMTVTDGGQPRRIEVPVEMPEGVSYEGVFGAAAEQDAMMKSLAAPMAAYAVGGIAQERVLMRRMPATRQASANMPALDERGFARPDAKPAKLDPVLAAIASRVKAGRTPLGSEAKLVRDGKVEVRVFLNDDSEKALAQLKLLGFEVVARPKSAKLIIGRIAVEKLEALSQLAVVRYVAPQA